MNRKAAEKLFYNTQKMREQTGIEIEKARLENALANMARLKKLREEANK